MIKQTGDNLHFYVIAQFTEVDYREYNAYTGSDSAVQMVRFFDPQLSHYWFIISGTVGGVTTTLFTSDTFYSDTDGVLELSLRYWLDKYSKATDDGDLHLFVYLNDIDGTAVDQADFTLHVYPGVSCADVPMPTIKDVDLGAAPRQYIMPPNVIVAPPLNGFTVVVECNAHDFEPTTDYKASINGAAITPAGVRGNEIEVARNTVLSPTGPLGLRIEQLTKSKTYAFEIPPACADTLMVQWTSLTGARRTHYFPIVTFGRDWEGESLVSVGDGLRMEKNTVMAVRCRLSGLTAYGYWYYMDLLTANDVHAAYVNAYSNKGNVYAEMESNFSRTTIEGGTAETPAGNGFYTFEFTAKLRHYDTF